MAYKLMLVPGVLSYSGLVDATRKNPLVIVDSKEVANSIVATGYFSLINSQTNNETEETGSASSSVLHENKYTETDLKKLSKSEQEEIIIKLAADNEVPQTKNESERIALILQLQEQEA